jgi:isoleucyl-tRNA synthetase
MDEKNTQLNKSVSAESPGEIKSKYAVLEEEILEFWKKEQIFKKSLEKESTMGDFVFYEGPPTANGRPGIHHLEARAFKDAIPRYKTMRGYRVLRKGGWDTHGLPVELEVEKELGFSSKKQIEEYGIDRFNTKCRESVWKYLDIWNRFTERIGYWVDQENPYITYENNYIESLWNVVSEVNKKNLLYKDYKVVPWCPRCGTGLSSHELAQGYADIKDLSVYVKFKVIGQEHTYILAWTTTPWTLPCNVALAVGEDIDYVKIQQGEIFLILAKSRLSIVEGEYKIIEEKKGKDLIGLEYEPLYPFLKDNLSDSEKPKLVNAFKIYGASFVTTNDGTGVVHTAVMYGADDFELGTKIGLPKHHLVSDDGHFKQEAGFLAGRFVKDEETAVEIIKDLAARTLLFKKEKYEHSYPHCWRCKTPLIYFARDSWYIKMSELRDSLVKENESINWEPKYIRDGRFGEWLKDIKDWAISRERYWGTPLPLWESEDGERIVIGSLADLKEKVKKSGNTYTFVRHGQSQSNESNVFSSGVDDPYHLTEKGQEQTKQNGEKLKNKKIDLIFTSPFIRTKETADKIAEEIGFSKDKIIVDDRLKELNVGDLNGKPMVEFFAVKRAPGFLVTQVFKNGESYVDAKNRLADFLYEVDKKYSGKNILVVTHGVMFESMKVIENCVSNKEATDVMFADDNIPGDMREMNFVRLPHNEKYELDFHKPYIDEVILEVNNKEYKRVKEVMDVWFDSGAMPFAQHHYPFDFPRQSSGQVAQGQPLENQQLPYPADFICEAIDQTRGWFYTLHAVGALMDKGKAYKNVICLGHILDKNGKKMSKSVGNVIDPWMMIDTYGSDTLRLWMYSVNQPGDSKNFDEKTVLETQRKIITLLQNVFSFYDMYRDKTVENDEAVLSKNILDKWIIARMNHLVSKMTNNIDNFDLLNPVRDLRDFIDDLSTWYLRRSRDRLKIESADKKEAQATLYFILKTTSKLLAPFAPFVAEDLYRKLRNEKDPESVHLSSWPEGPNVSEELFDMTLIEDMEKVRNIVTLGLESRQRANIKVRQPLGSLKLKQWHLNDEFKELIKDELNIKEILVDPEISEEVLLDTFITPELKEEGDMREVVRAIQDLRKKTGLSPSEPITVSFSDDEKIKNLAEKYKTTISTIVGAKDFVFTNEPKEMFDISDYQIGISIKKI